MFNDCAERTSKLTYKVKSISTGKNAEKQETSQPSCDSPRLSKANESSSSAVSSRFIPVHTTRQSRKFKTANDDEGLPNDTPIARSKLGKRSAGYARKQGVTEGRLRASYAQNMVELPKNIAAFRSVPTKLEMVVFVSDMELRQKRAVNPTF